MTILAEMLTEAGHRVLPVGSGAEAMRVFMPGLLPKTVMLWPSWTKALG
jgi:hypothetical protein